MCIQPKYEQPAYHAMPCHAMPHRTIFTSHIFHIVSIDFLFYCFRVFSAASVKLVVVVFTSKWFSLNWNWEFVMRICPWPPILLHRLILFFFLSLSHLQSLYPFFSFPIAYPCKSDKKWAMCSVHYTFICHRLLAHMQKLDAIYSVPFLLFMKLQRITCESCRIWWKLAKQAAHEHMQITNAFWLLVVDLFSFTPHSLFIIAPDFPAIFDWSNTLSQTNYLHKL